jgi:hypothetical protein
MRNGVNSRFRCEELSKHAEKSDCESNRNCPVGIGVVPDLGSGRRIMDDLMRVASLVAITVLSIQMGLFFNWALLSLMLKAMNRVRPTAVGSTQSSSTPPNWA